MTTERGVRATGCAAIVVLLALAGSAQAPRDVTLKVGESRSIATDLVVRFEAVLSDSRCPSDAQCVVAGDAVVRIQATTRGGTARSYELHTDDEPRDAKHGAHRLEVFRLSPLPKADGPPRANQYALTLRVR